MDWDWSTIASFLVAFATFVMAGVAAWQGYQMKRGVDLSRKELSLLRAQTDLYRQERELAKRPNIFVKPYGSMFAWKLSPNIVGERKEMLYFLLLNMSEHPIEYSGGFIYEWRPGGPIEVDPGKETGRITFLDVARDKGATSFVKPGEQLVLIPVEEEAVFRLFPEHAGQESTFLVVFTVLYPRAPGGIVYVRIPIKLRWEGEDGEYSDSMYVGWSMDEYTSVDFPVADSRLHLLGFDPNGDVDGEDRKN